MQLVARDVRAAYVRRRSVLTYRRLVLWTLLPRSNSEINQYIIKIIRIEITSRLSGIR